MCFLEKLITIINCKMKMINLKIIFSILMLILVLNSVLLNKRVRKSKRNEHMSKTLLKYSSMINPEVLNNKHVKNLLTKNFNPETNEDHKLLLIKSLIAGVLKVLNVPDDKIDAKINIISKEDLLKIMKILIRFHKSTSHVNILQELGQFQIEGLNVSQIFPGLAMNVTEFLAKHIRLHGRR